jgi:hypothetical protein
MSLDETPMLLRYRERVGAERYGIEVEIDDPHSTRAGDIARPRLTRYCLRPPQLSPTADYDGAGGD